MKYKCDCCDKEDEFGYDWIYFKFKYLTSVWVCKECQPIWKDAMVRLQERSL